FLVAPAIIRRLRAMAVHQVVREGTPDTHAGKGTTPTMGGLIILVAAFVPLVLWGRYTWHRGGQYLVAAMFITAWMGGIGLLDDYLKLRQKRLGLKNEGLVELYKLAGQLTAGLALGLYVWRYPLSTLPGA